MEELADDERATQIVAALFGIILLLIGSDLVSDSLQGVGLAHVWLEGAVLLVVVTGLALSIRRYAVLHRQTRRLKEKLAVTREDADRWRREAEELLEGLGEAIDRQFERWDLTPAEREVALFLLKGFSHKEVAQLRNVSDRTVRQQAHSVYEKADVSGRAELSAFFLEDLLLPEMAPIDAPEGARTAE